MKKGWYILKESKLAYTVEEVAKLLSISETSVRRLIAKGVLSQVDWSLDAIRIPAQDVQKLVEKRKDDDKNDQ